MLEIYFQAPTRLRQLRRGLLSAHINSLAAHLHQQGYSHRSAREILALVGKFSLFARAVGVEDVHQIDGALAERFLTEELPAEGRFERAPTAIRLLLQHLCFRGVITEVKRNESTARPSSLLDAYDAHLRDVRGLSASTCEAYLKGARVLLAWLEERLGDRSLAEFTGLDVLEFITEQLDRNPSASWRKRITSQTRIFLRYLHWAELIERKLDRVVPKVRTITVIDGDGIKVFDGIVSRSVSLCLKKLGRSSDRLA